MIEQYVLDQYVAWWLNRDCVIKNSQTTRLGVLFEDFRRWLKDEKRIYDEPRRLRFGDALSLKGFGRVSKYRSSADERAITIRET